MENTLKGSLQESYVVISEKILIDAFARFTHGLIPFKDVPDMIKHPSKYDTALVYLLDRFLSSSMFAFVQCSFFGVEAVDIYHMRNYIRHKLTKKEKNLLRKWKEQL